MPRSRLVLVLTVAACAVAMRPAGADTVTLKNGIVYRGTVDRDNTLVFIFDGIKRIFLRDSKIDHIESDRALRNLETFKLVQPLEVHGLDMPSVAYGVQATQWDEFGRRSFRYIGPKSSKPVMMKQALIELGPYMVTFRGIDGSWRSQLSTKQVPKPVVLGLLGKVIQTDENERKRVVRFLIQSEWYAEAKKEIDRLEKDFPSNAEQLKVVRQSVQQLEADQCLAEIDVRRRAQQPKDVVARLKAFPTAGVPIELLENVRDQLRKEEALEEADRALAERVQELAEQLPDDVRKGWKSALVEILAGLAGAPDAVRSRLAAFQKAEPAEPPEDRFALALTGWMLGSDAAVPDLAAAERLWKARELIADYLRSPDPELRSQRLASLQALEWVDKTNKAHRLDLDTATRMALLMPPPLADDERPEPGKPRIYQVLDDGNKAPTEYAVLLPPEYHPLRSYPTVLALHSGQGETSTDRIRGAVDWWAAEATRRGYIVVAPEYNLPGQAADYRYKPSEHAAAELALRDAKRRFAVDSDRVFLGGQLLGGNMAWDYGLAHPDLFAGVAIISGLPAKYVDRYRSHAERVPLYIALGDLAPAANELVFGMAKAMILKTYEVTYVDYFRRGLEDLPEEAVPVFDWMDHRSPRDAYPKRFEAVSARTCDDRFYGVVIGQFVAGRTMAPEAVDVLGKNLNPATIDYQSSAISNLIKVTVNGVSQLDVWVSPKILDFKKRLEVRVNGRAYFKGPVKLDLSPFLEDLRIRGDRQQVYWLKVSAR
jgi:dienelactone hydrolase